jgi:hypothetical protein
MPQVTIAARDLMDVRRLLHDAARRIEEAPCPEADPGRLAARRAIKQINRALVQVYGHDCGAYLFVGISGPGEGA